jgi:hypothetical protein
MRSAAVFAAIGLLVSGATLAAADEAAPKPATPGVLRGTTRVSVTSGANAAASTAPNRTGTPASLGSVQSAMAWPMAAAATAGIFARHDTAASRNLRVASTAAASDAGDVPRVLGPASVSTVSADAEGVAGFTQMLGGATARAAGQWNNASSMDAPIQRIKPAPGRR